MKNSNKYFLKEQMLMLNLVNVYRSFTKDFYSFISFFGFTVFTDLNETKTIGLAIVKVLS